MFTPEQIKSFLKLKTPFYFYDLGLLEKTLIEISNYSASFGFHVHYAMKANVNEKILETIKSHGLGIDCVSGNEIKRAIESGFNPGSIVFAGVGKMDDEIRYALEKEIFCFNCESIQELEVLNDLAESMKRMTPIAIRINPHIQVNTHHYITTGLEENKFGINFNQLPEIIEEINKKKNLKLIGIHFHIGSQILEMGSFKSLCLRINEIQRWLLSRNIYVDHINVGGGLGINYYEPDQEPIPDFKSYFEIFNKFLERQKSQTVHFELGRAVVGQCGSLISKVLFIKKGTNKSFVIIDAGMTELIRPALYQSFHRIQNLSSIHSEQYEYDIVGPVCESSDCFGKQVGLPITARGDLIAIRSTGAYGEVMASSYNLRERAPSYYSSDKLIY